MPKKALWQIRGWYNKNAFWINVQKKMLTWCIVADHCLEYHLDSQISGPWIVILKYIFDSDVILLNNTSLHFSFPNFLLGAVNNFHYFTMTDSIIMYIQINWTNSAMELIFKPQKVLDSRERHGFNQVSRKVLLQLIIISSDVLARGCNASLMLLQKTHYNRPREKESG